MLNELKKISPQIWAKIDSCERILINIHVIADLDSIGSALGFRNVLEFMGKKVTVFSPEPISKEKSQKASELIGFDDILYTDISEIDLSKYDLFICLDTGHSSRVSRNKDLKFPLAIPTIVIDHHRDNNLFGEINLIEWEGHSASEILHWMCLEKGIKISPEAALCFFVGILTDTDRFRFDGVTSPDSFRAAADLIEIGDINFPKIIWQSFSKSNIILKAIGIGLSQAKEVLGGKVIITKISFEDLAKIGAGPESMKTVYRMISDTLSDSETSLMTAAIYQLSDNMWGVSIRSDNPFHPEMDSSLVARKFPGGGGHPHGAGGTMEGTYEEVEAKLLQYIKESYPNL